MISKMLSHSDRQYQQRQAQRRQAQASQQILRGDFAGVDTETGVALITTPQGATVRSGRLAQNQGYPVGANLQYSRTAGSIVPVAQ
jgi:hypothetical protein